MKIIIFQNGKQIRDIEVGIELIVSEAERKGSSDPIKATVAELEHILEQENFSVKEDELAKLGSIIADSVTTGTFPESVELQVKNMKKLPFFSKKTEPIKTNNPVKIENIAINTICYRTTRRKDSFVA